MTSVTNQPSAAPSDAAIQPAQTTPPAPKTSSSRTRRDKDDTSNPDVNLASVGNYQFVKTLGEGNFAKVKLAKHKITGTEVAIKIIDKTQLDEKKLSKLYREVRIMKMLHHPHIVKLYEVVETKHTVFLVMEYSSGGELYDYLVVHGRMKEKEARAKFRQILSAVAYCHKNRVIHRDLKAENLLLDENMNIKIADFGFSNMFDPDGKLDTFCGSPPYAAPELFQGKRYVGPEVDIWSLGVILYVLTTGCLPFDGKNLQEMRESVCRGKYRIPFYLSDSCEKLLRKFLIRDPFRRASLEMLIDDIWINESYPDSPITNDISTTVERDPAIIDLIEQKFKMPKEQIIASLQSNVYDDTAAIYYLMYYEKEKNGGKLLNSSLNSPTGAKTSATSDTSPAVPPVLGDVPPALVTKTASQQSAGAQSGATGPQSASTTKSGIPTIEEDAVLQTNAADALLRRPRPTAVVDSKSRRRRFTVGGEADMQKYADEDDGKEAQDVLRKLQADIRDQQQPRPAGAAGVTAGATNNVTDSGVTNVSANNSTTISAVSAIGGAPSENVVTRKRTNTIVGMFSKTKKGDEDGNGMQSGASQSMSPSELALGSGKEDGANKPRSLRFTFNSNTTSTKAPDEIVSEVIKTCNKLQISHKLASRYTIECSWNNPNPNPILSATTNGVNEPTKFEVEVCKLPRLKNLHGLKFKRLGGTTAEYKEICESLLSSLQI